MMLRMTVLTKPRMTVGEFLAWAEDRPGRYELYKGEVYAMSPESVGHTKLKGTVYTALLRAVRERRIPCHVLTDGATVRVDDTTAYEPDALVIAGRNSLPRCLRATCKIVVAR